MKKKILMTMFALWGVLQGAWCNDYLYLTFQNADGATKSLSVESLSITFGDGKLMATNVDGEEVLSLTDLSKMYFSKNASTLIGDVNMDGLVNITDAVCLVNYLLTNDSTGINLLAADVNNDSGINITDVVSLINLILE